MIVKAKDDGLDTSAHLAIFHPNACPSVIEGRTTEPCASFETKMSDGDKASSRRVMPELTSSDRGGTTSRNFFLMDGNPHECRPDQEFCRRAQASSVLENADERPRSGECKDAVVQEVSISHFFKISLAIYQMYHQRKHSRISRTMKSHPASRRREMS